jgi:hypothetical protein
MKDSTRKALIRLGWESLWAVLAFALQYLLAHLAAFDLPLPVVLAITAIAPAIQKGVQERRKEMERAEFPNIPVPPPVPAVKIDTSRLPVFDPRDDLRKVDAAMEAYQRGGDPPPGPPATRGY